MSARIFKVTTVAVFVLLLAAPTWATDNGAELGVYQRAPTEEEGDVEIVGRSAWPGPDGGLMVGSLCTYSWIDITGTGTPTAQHGDDDVQGPYPIGFSFDFYGATYTEFYTSSNGYIELGDNVSSLSNQCPLPNSSTPNNIISLMWDDLDPGDTGDPVYYESFGAGNCPWGGYPGACLVVLYDDFCHFPGGAACDIAGTWQAIFFDDDSIVMQFLDPGDEFGLSATTGIEGDDAAADHGLYYNCDSVDPTLANACLMYAPLPPTPILATSTKSANPGAAVPGEIVSYTIEITNNGSADALGATLVDPIPMGTVFAGGLFCSTGSCGYDGGAGEINWSGTVAFGTSELVTFDVMLEPGAPCGGSITNTGVIDDPDILGGPVLVEASFDVWDAVPFFTNLEADDGGFVAGQGEWEWGVPTYPPDLVAVGAHSGVNVWGVNLDDDADDTIGNHILSLTVDVPFTLPGYAVSLQWWDWYGDEAADYRQIWINGNLEFEFPVGDQRFWAFQEFDLSPWAGQTITIDFNLEVCCADPGPDGWYIDDIGIAACLPPPGLYLTPDLVPALGCNGVPQTHTFNLVNATGATDTFTLTYDNPTMNATVLGPPDVTLDYLEGVDFDVELTPDACLGDGESVVVNIIADGNGYNDTSTIDKTIGALGAWNAPDADMGPLPGGLDWWGMGYANRGGSEPWMIGGIIAGGATSTEAWYYDVVTGSWVDGGPIVTGGIYRNAAATLAGEIYKISGSVTSFTYTGLSDRNVTASGWQAIASEPFGRMDNVAGEYNGLIWSITGYSAADPADVRTYDAVTDTWTVVGTPAPFGSNYTRSGCFAGNTVYMYGDAATVGYTGLWSYNMDTGVWTNETPTGTPPPVTGIWAPSWVYNPTDGYCYMTGGATVPGGGDLATAFVYDPVTNAWMAQLPDFAGARAFHSAFIFNRPSDGHDLLCVAGGTDVNSVAYANTECYDFDGQTCPECADLAITKDNGQTDVTPGTMVTYTITVDNIGPNDVVGAMVDDMFPPEFTGVTWTCSGTGGGVCTASGAGDIADMIDLPVMGQVVYMATGLVGGGTLLENTATVSLPAEFIEIDPANNTSTDSDPIVGQGDLWVVKTSDMCAYLPGDTVTYTITVGNAGPDDVDGTVTDAFPADLTGVTWTCAATGAATCTASGAGDISDPVSVPFGDTVTYTAMGVIDMGTVATSLSNTASVSSIFFDPDMTNNDWTDTVPLELPIFCDGFESGDTLMWSSTVP